MFICNIVTVTKPNKTNKALYETTFLKDKKQENGKILQVEAIFLWLLTILTHFRGGHIKPLSL